MQNTDSFFERFRSASDLDRLQLIEDHPASFFAGTNMTAYYALMKSVDVSASDRPLPALVLAWLAFLCGDNAGLHKTRALIEQTPSMTPQESSLFYALRAIARIPDNTQDILKHAQLAVDVLPRTDASFYMANAKLTCAQIYAGLERYRDAATMFDDAYGLFLGQDMGFPAAVAAVNKLLNLYRLGEAREVIDEANGLLNRHADFSSNGEAYWRLLELPLGLCCLELNKPDLAIEHLLSAKECVDRSGLLHMHGQIELCLFKAYYSVGDTHGYTAVAAQTQDRLSRMHYDYLDLLIRLFRILSRSGDDKRLRADIEWLELAADTGKGDRYVLTEAMAYLKINRLTDGITVEQLLDSLEHLRYTGYIPQLQLFLILTAELYFMNRKLVNASSCLKEAVKLKKQYGLCFSFFLYELRCVNLIKAIDERLYEEIVRKKGGPLKPATPSVLSEREREILSLAALGKSNEDIGKELFIGIGTIKWHMNNILSKLDAKNRTEAAQKARARGEID